MLPDNRFKLDDLYKNKPTEFEFDFIINDIHFSYGFSYIPDKVEEEWLIIHNKTSETPVFERKNTNIIINNKLYKGDNLKRLKFMAEDLLENQLFLNAANHRKLETVENSEYFTLPYYWFLEKLIIMLPDSRFVNWPLIIENNKIREFMKRMLDDFDTGITDLVLEEVEPENLKKYFPDNLLQDIFTQLENNKKQLLFNRARYQHYVISKENDEIHIKELKTKHKGKNQNNLFSFTEESDGTLRLTDYIPIFLNLNSYVYLIDEFDRSLHSEVLKDFLTSFINLNHNSQLVVSVHDTNLLNQDFFRRDEIWFIEKNNYGQSQMYSLLEYKPRSDKNLEKGYLAGRYGALPFTKLYLDNYLKESVGNGT